MNQRHIAYFDVHVPHNIDFKPVLAFQKDYKPTDIIIGGDFLNLEWASHWNEAVFKEVGFETIRENIGLECEAGRELLADIRRASPRANMHFIPGNHEHWLYQAALYFPAIGIPFPAGLTRIGFRADLAKQGNEALSFILSRTLQAEKFKMRVLPYNEHLTLGKINYLHGHQFNSPASTARLYPTKNIVYGHHHTHHTITLNDNGDAGTAVQHVAVPCMTELAPGYLRDKSTRWLNGFWLAEVLDNGLFDGRVKKILGGNVMVP